MRSENPNYYAQVLAEQGKLVISESGIDWFKYGRFMIPAYLPHRMPNISEQNAGEVLKRSRCPFVRWESKIGEVSETGWWYIVKKGRWTWDECTSKTRNRIRRAQKYLLRAERVSPDVILKEGYEVCKKAVVERYKKKEFLPEYNAFQKRINAAKVFPDNLHFFGVFEENKLVGFAENYIQDKAVFWESIWYDPEYLSKHSSYILLNEMLDYYLNREGFLYITDGSRNIYHKTNVHEFMIDVFGFQKEFTNLNLVYSSFFGGLLKLAYPFQSWFFKIQEKGIGHFLDKTCAIIRQESIRRACTSLPSPRADQPPKTEPDKVVVRPMQMGDIEQVVEIHRACFPNSVSLFSVLNPRLAWHLYAQYVEEPKSVGMVLVDSDSGRIAGYAAGTLQPGFHRRFLRSHVFRIAWHVLGGLCTKPVVWKMIGRALAAKDPFKAYRTNPIQFEKTPTDGPVGYFMPIAIHPDYRGGGNAVRLARALMDHFFALGAVRIRGNKIAIDNTASRKLFVEKLGWKSAVIENHCVMVWADRQEVQPLAGVQRTAEYPPVFITYGWCRSSFAVLWALGQMALEVHVGDASSLAMSRYSRYTKSFTHLPDFFVEPDRYMESLIKALKNTGAGVLLPCHEDIGLISRYRDQLPDHIKTAVPDWETYRVAEDKLKLMDIVSQCGCPAPRTHVFHSEQELDSLAKNLSWPAVLKTRIGNSAKGVAIAQNPHELKRKFHTLVSMYNLTEERWPFIQDYLPGRAAGVCALYDHGKPIAFFAEEYLRCKEPHRFGTSTMRKTLHDPGLVQRARGILDYLNWHGLAHLDFIQDADGTFNLIELNPRPWGAMALAVHAGIDFPWLWYQVAIGEKIEESGRNPREIYCRWILGDCFAFIELVKKGKLLEAAKIFLPSVNCKHDDWMFSDPLPFAFQYLDYLEKFIKRVGRPRRAAGGMVR